MVAYLTTLAFTQLLILIGVLIGALFAIFIGVVILIRVTKVKRLSAMGVEFYPDTTSSRRRSKKPSKK